MERFLFVAGGCTFWAATAWQGLHMTGLWVWASTAALLCCLLGVSLLIRGAAPYRYRASVDAPGGR